MSNSIKKSLLKDSTNQHMCLKLALWPLLLTQVVASSYAMHINMHRLVGSKQMFDNQMYLKIERLFGRSFLYLAVHIHRLACPQLKG